jgi:hypothetical protein
MKDLDDKPERAVFSGARGKELYDALGKLAELRRDEDLQRTVLMNCRHRIDEQWHRILELLKHSIDLDGPAN